jgi:hypothetical protein
MANERTIIESPFGTNPDGTRADPDTFARNKAYALRCLRYCLDKGLAGFGSHLLYPQVLDDATPEQREQGIAAGEAWAASAELVLVFLDYGVTPGMVRGINRAIKAGQAIAWINIGLNAPTLTDLVNERMSEGKQREEGFLSSERPRDISGFGDT